MKGSKKEFFSRFLLCLMAALIPLFLIILGIQANRYTTVSREVSELERKQEAIVEKNKKLISEISVLSSTDRIEKIATEELGMHKANTKDIVRIQMEGKSE